MPINEPPLTAFLSDHGEVVVIGATTTVGILDAPGEYVSDGMVISTDYRLTLTAADGGALRYGDSLTVAGVAYTVRDTMALDDGAMVTVQLQRNS